MANRIIRAIAFSQGELSPSSRFRVHQVAEYINEHAELNVEMDISISKYGSYPPHHSNARLMWGIRTLRDNIKRSYASRNYDICLLHREMLSTLYTTERIIQTPYIFDLDDAIWHTERFSAIKKIANRASAIIAGNGFIADKLSKWNSDIYIVPTAVNTKKFTDFKGIRDKTVVWSGSSSGLRYLYSIEDALYNFLKQHSEWKLRVVSNEIPKFQRLLNSMVEYIEWSPSTEVSTINTSSIGIMPLEDNDWERAKCSYKMLTYMSCGLPVVVSPVGMNLEVLGFGDIGFGPESSKDWIAALTYLAEDEILRQRLGQAGRVVIEDHFGLDTISNKIADIIKRTVK